MDQATFRKQFIGEFPAPTQRDIALHDQIMNYYAQTEGLDNRAAWAHSIQLHKWWKSRGYTQEEYAAAKRTCERSVPEPTDTLK